MVCGVVGDRGVDWCFIGGDTRREHVAFLGRKGGDMITVSSSAGEICIEMAVSDTVSRGCICIPHGWSDFNVNVLISVDHVDPLGGTAVLSGLPVMVS